MTLAGGDREALVHAAEVVRATHSRQPETARVVEHLAFTLLTAAYTDLTADAGRGRAHTPHDRHAHG